MLSLKAVVITSGRNISYAGFRSIRADVSSVLYNCVLPLSVSVGFVPSEENEKSVRN